ncbi:hypothetical protein C4K68_19505 [Pokkaliibacter plantistimulans]|uniref:Calcineurin-like phosphoesterase domain-containing protein n=1 Tax=Proteobacteria bacterium 228 TaxID=2083153 RepID=A0A2S5KL86_9PROT|nr:metallophosphoesterase [Pokkaliibacter plantistimulans]PPC75591.1 hypothetical protein C4K68_19505 [Pokkaliibacter plantistimulans]
MSRFTVLHLTDLHLTRHPDDMHHGFNAWQRWQQMIEHCLLSPAADQPRPDLLVLGGDLAQHPEAITYQALRQCLDQLDLPWVCVPGNHDDVSLMRQLWGDSAGLPCADQWQAGRWQLLLCDSTADGDGRGSGSLSAAALARLQYQLQHPQAEHQLVVLHHHLLPVNSPWQDEVMTGNAAEVLALLDQAPQLRGVLCGHVHQAHHWRRGHWQMWSTPAVAAQFAAGQQGFLLEPQPALQAPAGRWLQLGDDGSMRTSTVYAIRGST